MTPQQLIKEAKEQIAKAQELIKEAEQMFESQNKEDDKYFNVGYDNIDSFLGVRVFEEYSFKGFYLSSLYNWQIVKDSAGQLVLLPTKK